MDLNITKKKMITFDINIEGTNSLNLDGYLRLNIEGIEYGFPVVIDDDIVTAEIPQLDNIIKEGYLKDGHVVKAKLEIVANNDTYIIPWKNEFIIKTPVKIEASIKDDKVANKIVVEVKKSNTKDMISEINKKNRKDARTRIGAFLDKEQDLQI